MTRASAAALIAFGFGALSAWADPTTYVALRVSVVSEAGTAPIDASWIRLRDVDRGVYVDLELNKPLLPLRPSKYEMQGVWYSNKERPIWIGRGGYGHDFIRFTVKRGFVNVIGTLVLTHSHGLRYKASYSNAEGLLISACQLQPSILRDHVTILATPALGVRERKKFRVSCQG